MPKRKASSPKSPEERAITQLYYIRVALGIASGSLCGALKIEHWDGLTVALLIFLLTYLVFKRHYFEVVQDKKKVFTTGIFTYLGLWLVFWILVYTLLYG